MKVLNVKIDSNQQLATTILRTIERLVCDHSSAVKDGWRAIIEMQCYYEDDPYFRLDVQSNRGGGNYAEAKMAMLDNFGDLPATGLEDPKHFVECINQFFDGFPDASTIHEIVCRISVLDYIEQMPKDVAEFLREHGLTSYKGAIRVPYEILVSTEQGSIGTETGEIRIAFSGAEEWQDLFFATEILAELQQALNKFWECDQIWFNLRDLQADPRTEMWLKLLGVQEA